jgi:hypothetical protein
MHNLISEVNKLDSGIAPASIDGANTGLYFGMSLHRKALFFATVGVMAAAATSQIQVVQALDSAGTNSKDVTGAIATITANSKAARIKLAIVTAAGGEHVAGQTVTITTTKGDAVTEYVFTAAAADDPFTREYAVGASGADSAANLLAKINSSDSNIGIDGVIGVASIETTNSIITLKSEEPGEFSLTGAASAATTIVSTIEALAYVEIDSSALDVNNGFSHVAIKVTNSAAILTGISLLRGSSRYTPLQEVADSAVILS